MDLNLQEIGRRIREVRKFLGLTQVEVSKRLDLTQVSVSRLEKGTDLGSKNLLIFLKFYSEYINIEILFADYFRLVDDDKKIYRKDVIIQSIVPNSLANLKNEMNVEINDFKDKLNNQMDTIIKVTKKYTNN